MENNEQKKPARNFAFTALKPNEEKIDDAQKPEVKKLIEGPEENKSSLLPYHLVSERLKIMQELRLKKDMVLLGGEVEFEHAELFSEILKEYKKEDRYRDERDKMRWTQKKLAAHYILEGIKRDVKKFNLKSK
jgi:hypothetical protein